MEQTETITGEHCCVMGGTFVGFRWLRDKSLPGYFHDDLQQGRTCLECGKVHWSNVPIVEEGSEE
jgi:hypothetical protein